MERRLRILLANDDGINAEGIAAMRDALAPFADVTVVAPETEMSAVGHAITLVAPLRVREVERRGELFGYAVNGTPADCVKIAVRALLPEPPDLVVSGINHGQNVATNVIYSGTVSAATEGTILGIPSVAVSLASFRPDDFSVAAEYGARTVRKVADEGLPPDTLINVNVPDLPRGRIAGVAVCRMGNSKFREQFERRVDPRENAYYWQGGAMGRSADDDGADIDMLARGYVTVTPIHFDLTRHDLLDRVASWEI